jgi:hypothetical protein
VYLAGKTLTCPSARGPSSFMRSTCPDGHVQVNVSLVPADVQAGLRMYMQSPKRQSGLVLCWVTDVQPPGLPVLTSSDEDTSISLNLPGRDLTSTVAASWPTGRRRFERPRAGDCAIISLGAVNSKSSRTRRAQCAQPHCQHPLLLVTCCRGACTGPVNEVITDLSRDSVMTCDARQAPTPSLSRLNGRCGHPTSRTS